MKQSSSLSLKEKLAAFLRKQLIRYLFFGVCTTLVNIVIFQISYSGLRIPTLIANALAWVASVAFAYVTNRLFVFHSKARSTKGLAREITAFVGARLFSLVFDELIVWSMIDVMGVTPIEQWTADVLRQPVGDVKAFLAKVCANAVVVILNYLFSKFFIFRNPPSETSSDSEKPDTEEGKPHEA